MPVEAFCLASGPSLNAGDVELIRQWRSGGDRIVVVVNTTYQLAPWADVLYAMDNQWWNLHIASVSSVFPGMCVTCAQTYRKHGLIYAQARWPGWQPCGNSGAGAVWLAAAMGARRIGLLGYDVQRTQGAAHWHGDHPKPLRNALTLPNWAYQFKQLAKRTSHLEITNCSRETALTVFPRATLKDYLAPLAVAA